jgi:hypothetical protein
LADLSNSALCMKSIAIKHLASVMQRIACSANLLLAIDFSLIIFDSLSDHHTYCYEPQAIHHSLESGVQVMGKGSGCRVLSFECGVLSFELNQLLVFSCKASGIAALGWLVVCTCLPLPLPPPASRLHDVLSL